MAFTPEQQARIDAAQKRKDGAVAQWKLWNDFWTNNFLNEPCYKDTKYSIDNVTGWGFTPNDSSCTAQGDCKTSGKNSCKDSIGYVRNNISNIQSGFAELQAAQANYDQVFKEVSGQVLADPDTIKDLKKIEEDARASRLRWIFAIIVVIILGAAAFIWWKWFRK